MMKKVLAVLLAAAMILATLAGCSNTGSDDGTKADTTAAADTKGDDGADTEAADDGAADTEAPSGEVKHLIMTLINYSNQYPDVDKVAEAISAITRESIGVEVEIQMYDFASYKQALTLALSGGEQLDLITTITAGYTTIAQQGYLTDLNENDLLQTYGQGIIEAVGGIDNINATAVGGVVYGTPAIHDWAVGHGCYAIRQDFLEEVGYEVTDDDIVKATQEEVDGWLAKIHEAHPEIETYRATGTFTNQFLDIDIIGNNVFGVLLNYGEKPEVVNLFTADTYLDNLMVFRNYYLNGYTSKDAATDTTSVTTLMQNDALAAYNTGGKPGIRAQESRISKPVVIFQTKEDASSSSTLAGFPWAIPYTTVDPVASMKLLNEFYTNPELANLLAYGIEGTHYNLVNGQVELVENPGYTTLIWDQPNELICYTTTANDPDVWEKTKEFNQNAKKSVAAGFNFDPTNVADEISACTNVYEEYQKSLEFGLVDPEPTIQEMNERLMAAGLQKIIDEKQKQLDEFLASK
jgi:putative aldouronate transport system substrate-binding protein